jgi:uncharacterized membrane protein
MRRIALPMVTHSEPLMTPIFFTDNIVKKRSLSARSFQFLLFMMEEGNLPNGFIQPWLLPQKALTRIDGLLACWTL